MTPRRRPAVTVGPVTAAGAELTLRHPVERFRLDNGLRVVLAPDRSVPVVAVSVFYDVGMRNEPEGRTGFAHLFEHLMFQGSANVPKMEHARLVQAAGGTFNGSTHQDYTNYYQALPAEALERALFLEADRMAAPAITEENLRNQIDVVKEEIRVNVLNRPYGAFPWLQLPQVAFESFANTHDGYGSFVDLESSTVDDAADFFSAVLRAGQRRPLHRRRPRRRRDRAADRALVRPRRRPRRAAHARHRRAAAHHAAPRRRSRTRWRRRRPSRSAGGCPTRSREFDKLPGHRPARRAAQRGRRLAAGAPARARRPHRDRAEQLRRAVRRPLRRPGRHAAHHAGAPPGRRARRPGPRRGPRGGRAGSPRTASPPTSSRRVQARTEAQLLRQADSVLGRTLAFAAAEIVHGRAELAGELAARLAAVTPEQVQAAARALDPGTVAVLELRATGRTPDDRSTSIIPPLGEPRPQPVPDVAETTLPNGLRVVVVPRPGVPLIELRLRVPFAAADAADAAVAHRPYRRPVRCGAAGHAAARPDRIAQLLQGHGAELSVSSDPDRLLLGTTLLPEGLARGARGARRAADRGHLPRRQGRGRAGPRRRADRHRAVPARRSSPAPPCPPAATAPTPTRSRCPTPELVTAVDGEVLRRLHVRARTACRQHAGPGRRARPGGRHRRRRGGAGSAGRPPASPSRRRRWPRTATSGSQVVDRPGAVQSNLRLRRPGPSPHRPRPGGRPPGQHDLRRVLLLPAGREHPRAARLQLQPARSRRPPGRRLVVPTSRPTSPPR